MAEETITETPVTIDYASLVTDDALPSTESAKTETVETPEPQAETPKEATATETETKAEETPAKAEDKPAEGTPDKELQKLSQRQASIYDRLEKLLEQREAQGGKATEEQIAKAAALKAEQDEVASLLKEGYDIDPYADTKKVAKRVVDNESRSRQEIDELREQIQELRAASVWDAESKKYEGVNVRDVWAKAQDDAITMVSREHERAGIRLPDEQAAKIIQIRATELYESRCDAAKKSVSAKAQSTPTTTAPITKPKTTPGSASVMVGNRSPSPVKQKFEPTAEFYASLVKQD